MSRQTRLLLTTALLAAVALLLLTRVRLPEADADAGAVPQLLASLGSDVSLDALARRVGDARSSIGPDVTSVMVEGVAAPSMPAIRLRDDLFALLLPAGARLSAPDARVLAHDSVTGLMAIRLPERVPMSSPETVRLAGALNTPTYALGTVLFPGGVSLRPLFLAARWPIEVSDWPAGVCAVPPYPTLVPGTFVFTSDGTLVGMAASSGETSLLVPATLVVQEVDRALTRAALPEGDCGIRVQELTPSIARATGSGSGVVVSWVDREGAAGGLLTVGDVIEAVDGRAVPSVRHWVAHATRATAGSRLLLRVRRAGKTDVIALSPRAVSGTAAGTPPPVLPEAVPVGLAVRQAAHGATVSRVERNSLAARAGLEAGDVVTRIPGLDAPRAADVRRVLDQPLPREGVLIGVQRGDAHYVTAVGP